VKVLNVVGARPNFMKMAPLVRALGRRGVSQTLVHTGQHYDDNMSRVFFDDLGLPRPDIHLEVGSGTHAEQTAAVMVAFEPVCERERPDLVVVVGDVNSTLACTVVAAKLGVPVAHVEAGLRSFDMSMPEEVNRIVTDRLAELLLTPSPDGDRNLLAEGVAPERIHRVGNVMIDSLVDSLRRAEGSDVLERLDLAAGAYGVLTLHRPSNVDRAPTLRGILAAVERVSRELPIVFSCHPRTAARLTGIDVPLLRDRERFRVLEPLGYLDFLRLLSSCRLALTDSGGLQEETTYLGIPCVTIRENTERPVTLEQGTNTLAGTDPRRIEGAALAALAGPRDGARIPDLWDGRAAERIAEVFVGWSSARRA
jgi:UDP-N-acetylglucosamine 2-epimerase (non-hydrolysing)